MPMIFKEEDLAPEQGWSVFANAAFLMRPNFVFGHPEAANRLQVRYYRRDEDGALVGKAWYGPQSEGPPGHAHGGSMAALLDDLMGTSAWIKGMMVVAANIKIDFRNRLPLGSIVKFDASVNRVDGRKVFTRGAITDLSGKPYAEGEGLFIALKPEQFRNFSAPMA